MELKITEINGWSKLFGIKKAITQIGSGQNVDIQLPSNSIAALQLQILSNPDLPTGCRVVNMANPLEIKSGSATHLLEPFTTYNANNGDEIRLGEYQITFCLPLTTTLLRSSKSIEASLSFVDTILQPNLFLDGLLVVKNTGGKDACQFQVELSGLPEDCIHVDPIPLLYPGAQEEVRVRLFHHVLYPQAGFHDLLATINAPAAYPGEALVIKQGIYVAPVFKQSIEIEDDLITPAVQTENFSAEPENEQVPAAVEEQEPSAPVLLSGQKPAEMEIEEQPRTVSVQTEEIEKEQKDSQAILEEQVVVPEIQVTEKQPDQTQDTILIEQSQTADPSNQPPESSSTEPVTEVQPQPVEPEPKKQKRSPRPAKTVKQDTHEEIWADEPVQKEEKPTLTQELNLTKVKVVRNQAEQYWSEKEKD